MLGYQRHSLVRITSTYTQVFTTFLPHHHTTRCLTMTLNKSMPPPREMNLMIHMTALRQALMKVTQITLIALSRPAV